MIEWERIKRWDYIVDVVSSEYHKKYRDIDIQDIRQCLYEWFVEHPNKLTTWESIGEKDAKNLIYRSLRNQALDYCNRWKAKSGGYEVSDLFFYKAEIVEMLLPAVIKGDLGVIASTALRSGPGGTGAPSEGFNVQAMMIEVDYGYWKLSKEDRKVLFLRHADSLSFEQIAQELKLGSDDAARVRHRRIINKLINKIGGFKPYVDEDFDEVQEQSSSE